MPQETHEVKQLMQMGIGQASSRATPAERSVRSTTVVASRAAPLKGPTYDTSWASGRFSTPHDSDMTWIAKPLPSDVSRIQHPDKFTSATVIAANPSRPVVTRATYQVVLPTAQQHIIARSRAPVYPMT